MSDGTDDDDHISEDDWLRKCGENLQRRAGRPSRPYNSEDYVSAASGVAGRSGLDCGRVAGSAVLPSGTQRKRSQTAFFEAGNAIARQVKPKLTVESLN